MNTNKVTFFIIVVYCEAMSHNAPLEGRVVGLWLSVLDTLRTDHYQDVVLIHQGLDGRFKKVGLLYQ